MEIKVDREKFSELVVKAQSLNPSVPLTDVEISILFDSYVRAYEFTYEKIPKGNWII